MVNHLDPYWAGQKRTRWGLATANARKFGRPAAARRVNRGAASRCRRAASRSTQKRPIPLRSGIFLCAGWVLRSLHSPAAVGATWTFLLREHCLTVFCKGLYERTTGRCKVTGAAEHLEDMQP